jgi:hypothetical protein
MRAFGRPASVRCNLLHSLWADSTTRKRQSRWLISGITDMMKNRDSTPRLSLHTLDWEEKLSA